jgi:dTDP-glucose pyrophosphorylase
MNLLMPMAGAGQRFADAGFTQPKPFIEVDGLPMFKRAWNDLPGAEKNIFITRYTIPHDLLPEETVTINLDHITEGQAATCLLAKQYINNDEELVIGACDNGLLYDSELFNQKKQEYDALVFTFRHTYTVAEKPQQYGWVRVNGEIATGVSCKKPISETPMEDDAITGAFWFKKGSDFVKAAENMMAANRRINNEFYVDECINDLVALGARVGVFRVNKYICWGTPADWHTYHYWQNYFKKYPVNHVV